MCTWFGNKESATGVGALTPLSAACFINDMSIWEVGWQKSMSRNFCAMRDGNVKRETLTDVLYF